MVSSHSFFVIVPGGSQNPTHYGYLTHLLQQAGYPTFSALLPSVGASAKVTVKDDMTYIRERMILPILDHEQRDVILVMHSYSGVPGSAAALGLGKKECLTQGKKTGVIGQIYVAALLNQGSEGDGPDLFTSFGGQFPPHLRVDLMLVGRSELDLLRRSHSPLYHDVPPILADAAAISAMAQGLTSFYSPVPRASWDSEEYKDRVSYIRTVNDTGLPLVVQQMMIDSTGNIEWIVKGIVSGHSPQLSCPDRLLETLLDLANLFEEGEPERLRQ